jgi:hypothetical protein
MPLRRKKCANYFIRKDFGQIQAVIFYRPITSELIKNSKK